MKEQYVKWFSPNLGKDLEMMIYGHGGHPVLIFPSTKGRYYESKDFGLIESVKWFVEQGKVQLYCPDSIDALSWYNWNVPPAKRVENHNWYDKTIVEEVVSKIRWNTPKGKVAVAGCSFGGYHATNFAFRHPELTSHLFAMSAAFDIRDQMSGYYDEQVYFNNPVDFVPNLTHPDIYQMKIVLGTSEWDICRPFNEQFSAILTNKGVNHWLDLRGWQKHDWPLWREMFPHYLSLL